MQLLLCLKLKYPGSITLLRGKNETYTICDIYGLGEESLRKFGNRNVLMYLIDVFDYFGIAAIVDDRIFCVSAGISPDAETFDQIRMIDRFKGDCVY